MRKFLLAAESALISASFFIARPVMAATTYPSDDIEPIRDGGSAQDLIDAIDKVVGWMFAFAGALAVAYLVWAGIQYITGGAKGAEAAKQSIINAIIGIAVIVLAYVVVDAVVGLFK